MTVKSAGKSKNPSVSAESPPAGLPSEDISFWLEKILGWVDRCGAPRLRWVGRAGGGYANPPAPHIEIVYLRQGGFENLKIGDRQVAFPEGFIGLHSVHFGNFSPVTKAIDSWCVILDVADEPEFACLTQAPLFTSVRVMEPSRIVEAFERLTMRSQRYGWAPRDYLHPENGGVAQQESDLTAPVYIKTALLDLLAVLLDNARAVAGTGGQPRPEAIRSALEFMALHYTESNLALGDIANVAHLSIDHFGRLFKQHLGETPLEHLKRTRIGKSRFLLEQTDFLVEEVAREVGFEDPFHFSRVFHSVMGLSPKQYRAQSRARHQAK
jgi:AraC-like DNA-binding protein